MDNLPELLDVEAACKLIGGTRPINAATLYRGVRSGRYPQPIKIGASATRWKRSEIEAALKRMADERTESAA